jgi:hypothetical protein
MFRRLFDVLLIAALVVFAYFYRAPLLVLASQLQQRAIPCVRPVTYSIGTIDPRFKITRDEFLKQTDMAADMWNKGANRNLLAYDEHGTVKINFVYDDRQKVTQRLNAIDSSIDESESNYQANKSQYDSLYQDYLAKKETFLTLKQRYGAALSAYNAEVAQWNAKGGATQSVAAQLAAKRASLDNLAQQEQGALTAVNAAARASNQAALTLNSAADDYNASAATYNAVSQTLGSEFEEGQFVSTGWEEHIDVYQYNDAHTLRQLLAHELGHALGLDHVEDPQAVMYYLNSSTLDRITADDLSALDKKCGGGATPYLRAVGLQ